MSKCNMLNSSDLLIWNNNSAGIFDQSEIRITFYVVYTLVFGICVIGNLAVVAVIAVEWRMRSVTRFCMANLAFANLCVGIFCIYQNLTTFLVESWKFGSILCKMYSFISGLSFTASILILVVVCVERYLSLVKPIQYRSMLTIQRVRLSLLAVWFLSGLICSPRFYYVTTFENPMKNDINLVVCAPNRSLYNSKIVDMTNFIVLFLLPLIIMSVLYAQIATVIWKNSLLSPSDLAGFGTTPSETSKDLRPQSIKSTSIELNYQNNFPLELNDPVELNPQVTGHDYYAESEFNRLEPRRILFRARNERFGGKVLRSRKSAIRMLISVVVTFAVCNLPYHLRKICQYYVPNYNYDSPISQILTPVTFILMYSNCAINPILYAFMSKSFRKSFLQVIKFSGGDQRACPAMSL